MAFSNIYIYIPLLVATITEIITQHADDIKWVLDSAEHLQPPAITTPTTLAHTLNPCQNCGRQSKAPGHQPQNALIYMLWLSATAKARAKAQTRRLDESYLLL